ncbi:metallophosphoesterase [Bombilactobacillus folatiphilus]|uniref:Metallophosphoesterase n=1 Tax=Bombilactobacillus folatiphilus TaxID=2923362 RepID=A0ABY4P8H4_9LACO|nr:metallophosphoesterase [Bombilactobacillus folatiphilus]UQS82008.1 metallophosphoesterase [Bombilactobacillus folatiphilus]
MKRLLTKKRSQPQLVPVQFLQQSYQLQTLPQQQILWPTKQGQIYYRLNKQHTFAPMPVTVRPWVRAYLQAFCQVVQTQIDPKQSLTLGMITDTHVKFKNSSSYYGFNGWQHVNEFLELPHFLPIDLLVHLGDVIDGSDDPYVDRQLLRQVANQFAQQKTPSLIAKGNHDDHDKYDEHTRTHRATFAADTFEQAVWLPEHSNASLHENLAHCGLSYFDQANFRVIMLNTSDLPYIIDKKGQKQYDGKLVLGLRQQQVQILTQLLQASVNKQVLILSHANLLKANGQAAVHNGKAVHDLLKAFNQGLVGQLVHQDIDPQFSLNVEFDFRENQTGRVWACLAGHRHTEAQYRLDSIQYVLLNVSALMGKKHFLTTKFNRAWHRQKDQLSEFAGYIVNLNVRQAELNIFGYGAATFWRKFKIS